MGFPGGSEIKASACNARDPGSIPGSGKSPGKGNGIPLQYSCLENSMNRGAWQTTSACNVGPWFDSCAGKISWRRDRIHAVVFMGSPCASDSEEFAAVQVTWIQSLGWEDPLEKEMASHSSILVWRIQWMEKPGRLQSMGSQRVGQDWLTDTK